MKKKNKLIKFFQKAKRARKRKKFWKNLLSFKKNRKKQKKTNERFLIGLVSFGFFLLVFLFVQQLMSFSRDLIQLEAVEDHQKIQLELEIIEDQMMEIETDFENNLKLADWKIMENRRLLETKIRRLNYLNAHLVKTIEAYNNDFSLQLYRSSLGWLENVFREAQNVQLISSRIVNKIDTLLLFDRINENQKELLRKDFELFYEKIKLINCFSF